VSKQIANSIFIVIGASTVSTGFCTLMGFWSVLVAMGLVFIAKALRTDIDEL
jgi:hypothetical protein